MGREDRKQYVSDSPTGGKWFGRFMHGTTLRMGVERHQNEALTLEIVLALDRVAEVRWAEAQRETEREKIEEVMTYTLCAFGAGLRGEEVPMLSMRRGLLTFWEKTTEADCPHVMLTLKGRFKGETNKRWHCVPIVDVTESGIPMRKWLQCLVIDRQVSKQHQCTGWLFWHSDKTKGKISDYDSLFKDLIGEVKEMTEGLIPDVTQVEDFSLWRSPRQGSITNKKVNIQIIELINRWRKKEAAKGAEPGLPMRQVYTAIKHAVPAMLEYLGVL